MSTTHPPGELLARLCHDLRQLREQAGGPSVRSLSAVVGLGKSQVTDILNGRIRRPPDWRVVRGLVDACYRHATDGGRAHQLSVRAGVDEYWRPRFAMVEHAFTAMPAPADEPAATVPAGAAPRQLPPAAPHFVGRRGDLTALTRASRTCGPVLVSGTAGVGKTTLVTQWAHRNADRFPDGQLFVNLRGFDPAGSLVDPADALHRFLTALGVAPHHVPSTMDAQIALYRSLLAGRRVLVVLDNARDAAQVRPLLPAAPGCRAVVTSRDQLPGLIAADGAHPVALATLTTDEAHDLLARRIGSGRVRAEPAAVADIVERCARLPLALAVVAARAAIEPATPLAVHAAGLRDALAALTRMSGNDVHTDVRAVLSWSYLRLSPPAARLFRLIGLHPGPDLTAQAAASLAGAGRGETLANLVELVRSHLVAEQPAGRYGCHDLLRGYATELGTGDPASDCADARRRLLDHYLHSGHGAALQLDPHRDRTAVPPAPAVGVTPEIITDGAAALAWFTAEHRALIASVDAAHGADLPVHAWQLAWTVMTFLHRDGRQRDQLRILAPARAGAERLGDRAALAYLLRTYAIAHAMLGDLDSSAEYGAQALGLFEEIGDPVGQAHVHMGLAARLHKLQRPHEAIVHSTRALDLYRSADNAIGEARALNDIGWTQARLGEPATARDHYRQALHAQQRTGDTEGEATTWDSLGQLHHELGEHAEAARCLGRSGALRGGHGDRLSQASTLVRLGDAHAAAGADAAARDAWQQALAFYEETGHADAAGVRGRLT